MSADQFAQSTARRVAGIGSALALAALFAVRLKKLRPAPVPAPAA